MPGLGEPDEEPSRGESMKGLYGEDPQTWSTKHQLLVNCTDMPVVLTLETHGTFTGLLLARRQHREDV